MPAFVDWNSLLFGSSTGVQTTDKVASHTELDASLPESLENWNAPPGSAIPEAAFIKGERGWRSDRERGGENVRGSEGERRGAGERVVSDNAIPESGILGSAIPGFASESSAPQRAIDWIAGVNSIDHQFAITTTAAVVVGAFFLWLFFGRRKRSFSPFQRLTAGEKVLDSLLDALKQEFAQKTEDFETQLNQALKQQAEILETQYQQALKEQTDAVEEQVRKSLNKQVETLEVRIKLDQEAFNNVHRMLSERMEAFENYVRTIDSKHLDQEANSIAQHTLSQRLDAVEEGSRNIDSKARSLSQRIEAIDDSVRVIDSRAKALSQRVEAAEDNLNSTDGQVTLLSHDVNRGSSVLEKLQRHVKSKLSLRNFNVPGFYAKPNPSHLHHRCCAFSELEQSILIGRLIVLPDSEKFKGLSRSWEAKLKRLETKIDE